MPDWRDSAIWDSISVHALRAKSSSVSTRVLTACEEARQPTPSICTREVTVLIPLPHTSRIPTPPSLPDMAVSTLWPSLVVVRTDSRQLSGK
jgi:hypothetical protein